MSLDTPFFRYLGDMSHLASFFIILHKIYIQKNCSGISLKTQFLYVLVFITRYLDLFTTWVSLYNTLMKILFIGCSIAIVYFIKYKEPYSKTYDSLLDDFKIEYILIPCAILSLLINGGYEFLEILWTFSIYLEAVAIIPQLIVVQKYANAQRGFVEGLTSNYVFTLGAYRALYLVNWLINIIVARRFRNWIAFFAGIIQTGIYVDFFYYYLKSKWEGKSMVLPV